MSRYSLFWCNKRKNKELSRWGILETPHLYLTYTSLDTSLLSWSKKWGLSEVYLTYLTRLCRPIYLSWSLIKWVSEVNHAPSPYRLLPKSKVILPFFYTKWYFKIMLFRCKSNIFLPIPTEKMLFFSFLFGILRTFL